MNSGDQAGRMSQAAESWCSPHAHRNLQGFRAFSATVNHHMTSDLRARWAARGRRVSGLGRPSALLIVTLALVLVGVPSSLAVGASGSPALTIPLPIPVNIQLPAIGVAIGQGGGAAPGPAPTTSAPSTTLSPPPPQPTNPFNGRAMWIWELPASSGGNLATIIARAKQYGVSTVFIKSSDGTSPWGQFSRAMIATFKAAGLRVCAWQYVYGQHPADEARLGAGAVREGAACLVIDAESEYEGRYASAQRYVTLLRAQVGANFPVGLAGFPWIDYHPAFPYSVFLGSGGAQYNLPQMYWKDIGTSVDNVYAHTYLFNRLYQRPIYPLGQLYSHPPTRQVIRFRQLSSAYGATGVSWWDYQEATTSSWRAISVPAASPAGFVPSAQVASLGRGGKGDTVVWAQEHLYTAGYRIPVDGGYGPRTQTAVAQFQAAHGIAPTGVIDVSTWTALLKYKPAYVHWAAHSKKKKKGARAASASSGTPPPLSASLPGRNELRGSVGRGR
ncbi:MAG: peptidoglycan-binding protein [Actinomycetota bacterium]|nr:peptidoglycan-binding protein [Actinomycetota bacterium]